MNVTRDRCRCQCHTNPRVRHVTPCCQPIPRITDGFLRQIVEASIGDAMAAKKLEVQADEERLKQATLTHKINQTVGSGDDKEDSLEKELEKSAPTGGAPKRGAALAGAEIPDAPPATQRGNDEINGDSIIDKFNIIRSGHSMNDRDIRDRLQQYLGSLTQSQRNAVFAILKNIGGIVAPAAPLARTQAPQEEPTAVQNARLQMLKQKQTGEQPSQPAPQQQAQQPQEPAPRTANAAPRRAAQPPAEEPDEEDTSPPIRVGRRATESVKARMKLLLQE